jgi:aspartyl-tRNA(Asn)/glutamyl-tRNA(Gln) amidotransferase subunit C
MKISRDDIKTIARLSRLEVSEKNMPQLEKELSDILSYVEQLNELNLDGVETMAHAVPLQNVLREDQVKPSIDHDKALSTAPVEDDGYFAVPRVVQN